MKWTKKVLVLQNQKGNSHVTNTHHKQQLKKKYFLQTKNVFNYE